MLGARAREAGGEGVLRAKDSRVTGREEGKGILRRTIQALPPSLYSCPSPSPNIQTLYFGLRGWGMVSLIIGEQEP